MPLNIFDGSSWNPLKKIQVYDGTSWNTVPSMATDRRSLGGAGTAQEGLGFGGLTTVATAAAEPTA